MALRPNAKQTIPIQTPSFTNGSQSQIVPNSNAFPIQRQNINQITNSPGLQKGIVQIKGVPSGSSPLLQQRNDQQPQIIQSLGQMDNMKINSEALSSIQQPKLQQPPRAINLQSNIQQKIGPGSLALPQSSESKNIQIIPTVQRIGQQVTRSPQQNDISKSSLNPSIEQNSKQPEPQQPEPQQPEPKQVEPQQQKKKIVIQNSGFAPCPQCKQECQGQQVLLTCKHCYHYGCFYELVKGNKYFNCVECNQKHKREGLRKYYENGKAALNQIYNDQLHELFDKIKQDNVLLQCQRQQCEYVCISHQKTSYCPLCLSQSRFRILQ